MSTGSGRAAFLAQIERASTIAEIQACIERYYEDFDNPTGGSLHIVLDDRNLDDDDVLFCIRFAETGFLPGSANGVRPDYQADPDPLGAALGRKLLALSPEDRRAAVG